MLRVWARKGRDGGVSCGPPPPQNRDIVFVL